MESFPTAGETFQVARWALCHLERVVAGIRQSGREVAIRKVRVSWKVSAVSPEAFLMAPEVILSMTRGGSVLDGSNQG